MRIISERVLDIKEDMFLCFIDWQKDFDRVYRTKLLEMFKNVGVNCRERRLIRNLHMGKRVKLRLNKGETDSVKIGRGVLTRLGAPRSRPDPHLKLWKCRKSNPRPHG